LERGRRTDRLRDQRKGKRKEIIVPGDEGERARWRLGCNSRPSRERKTSRKGCAGSSENPDKEKRKCKLKLT